MLLRLKTHQNYILRKEPLVARDLFLRVAWECLLRD